MQKVPQGFIKFYCTQCTEHVWSSKVNVKGRETLCDACWEAENACTHAVNNELLTGDGFYPNYKAWKKRSA